MARLAAGSLAAAVLLVAPLPAWGEAPPDAARQRELRRLLDQDCGSCHGLARKGGLGPALTPHALRERPVDSLVATIQHGRAGTAMPPWQRFMNERETRWLVEHVLLDEVNAVR